MTEAPKVYCPKDKEKVPIWYCLGSHMQGRKPCPHILTATIDMKNDATKVECKGWEKDEQNSSN